MPQIAMGVMLEDAVQPVLGGWWRRKDNSMSVLLVSMVLFVSLAYGAKCNLFQRRDSIFRALCAKNYCRRACFCGKGSLHYLSDLSTLDENSMSLKKVLAQKKGSCQVLSGPGPHFFRRYNYNRLLEVWRRFTWAFFRHTFLLRSPKRR